MILADLASSKVAAEGDAGAKGGEGSWERGTEGREGREGKRPKGSVGLGELVCGRHGGIKVSPCHYPLMRDAKG